MKTFNKVCTAFVVLLVIYLIFLELKPGYYYQKEGFKMLNNKKNSFKIKKTMKFKKVYSCKSYTIWIPVHIDNYFPVYQICCKGNSKPDKEAILVEEDPDGNDLPKSYDFIGVTSDDVSIWKPVPKKGFVSIGHIFSKKKPSKYAIRCVREENTRPDRLKNVIVSEKTLENQKYTLWSGYNSPSFLCSELTGSDVPKDELHYIKESLLKVEDSLEMKLTNKYEKVFEKSTDKSHLTIWKPIPPKNYKCVGYISLANGVDPNGVLKTPVLHKKHCRKPLNYGDKYFGKIQDNKDKTFTFWKPTPPSGYGCLSNLIINGTNEPEQTDLIYCVSLDYLKSNPYSRNMIWNNLPNTHNMISIWTNKNDFFHASVTLNHPTTMDFNLDMNFIKVDRDVMDLSKDIVMNYKLNINNTDVYDELERETLIKKTLSSRFDIDPKRLTDLHVNENKREIRISIQNRELNSGETTVNELINRITNTLEKEEIKIYNKNKNNYISKLTGIHVDYKTINDTNHVPLDTSSFLESIN